MIKENNFPGCIKKINPNKIKHMIYFKNWRVQRVQRN